MCANNILFCFAVFEKYTCTVNKTSYNRQAYNAFVFCFYLVYAPVRMKRKNKFYQYKMNMQSHLPNIKYVYFIHC